MAVGERPTAKQQRRKTPSFSSSLLDAIYHSIDEPREQQQHLVLHRRNNAAHVEEEIESLRRAIMVEKWMENYTKSSHHSSNSASSTDSSIFSSSSETDSSASARPGKNQTPKCEGRFTRTKSRALKIYGDLKKVKEPISPGGKLATFWNSIFSPKKNQGLEQWGPVRKSRSMRDTTTCSLASRSCLSKNPSSSSSSRVGKSKRSVRFCPAVSVIVDEDHSISVGSQFIKKNIDSFRVYDGKKNVRKHEFREPYENESDDDESCASSDLFELENIGRIGYEEELPVYGTTNLKMNRAIASGFIV